MSDFSRELKTYKKQIKKLLLVKTDASARFLEELENNIADFVEAESVSDMERVCARFGTPEEIAREFFTNTDLSAIREKLRLKRTVAAVLMAALLLWSVALGLLYFEAKNDLHGSFTEQTQIVEGDGR